VTAAGVAVALLAASFFLIVSLAAAAAVVAAPRAVRRSAFGLLTGASCLPFLVAWYNRFGPGIVRWHTATASGWETQADPRPWLAAGLALLAAGVAGQILMVRRGSRRSD
jgi:hypothetical protein